MDEKWKRPYRADEETPEERRFRMRHDWQDLIENLIADGKEKGLFDNLKGAGKPLNYQKNPYAPEMEFAHTLLKENDMAPVWIMARKQILAEIAELRDNIAAAWSAHVHAFQHVAEEQKGKLIVSWDDACLSWLTQIARLNRRIDDYNLKRPIERLELFKLTLESELKRIGARRYL
ncbi:MAG: hypothetical protein Kow0080_03170 [Candidatus Promineifilaceae bacterium]